MLSLHYLLLRSNRSSPFAPFFQWVKLQHQHQHGGSISSDFNPKKKTGLPSSSSWIARAVEKDAEQLEIYPEEAKEALRNLEQQLQTLSDKQVSTPKIRAADVKLTVMRWKKKAQKFQGLP
ncbi:uncharacterized protein LOC120132122 [Hibiscus syriacus]|uniref:uncharacterized protein LOC120132122 n=1 Tax=Hibiscus syriacus TaxID=106335 RepID=UPI001922AEF6|nr:uncharacterized protein LOC120132122 [Hibiscus syriacus]